MSDRFYCRAELLGVIWHPNGALQSMWLDKSTGELRITYMEVNE